MLLELYVLLQHRSLCKLWLQLAGSTKLPVKANCFHSIARILSEPTHMNKSPDQMPEENSGIWSLHERLFNSIGVECRNQATMPFLMNALRQPFEELRTAIFSLMRAVAVQNNEWGMRTLQSYGGLFEFLMDRTTEPTKETREWKFAIVDAIVASPFQANLGTSGQSYAAITWPVSQMDSHSSVALLYGSTHRPRDAGEAQGALEQRSVRWVGAHGHGAGVRIGRRKHEPGCPSAVMLLVRLWRRFATFS